MATTEPPRAPRPPSTDVERAEHSDAAGAHSDAIEHLATGARKHDVEALTRLGKRLLVGDRAPCLPKDGAGLIADASARGGAEAAALLAVLYAVGASRGYDVQAGFESLIVAAERGWPAAQAQLDVLAAAASITDQPGDGAGSGDGPSAAVDWRAVGRQVDLSAWTGAPAGTDLSSSPLIRAYPEFVTPRMCRWFIERARGRLSRALVYEAMSREVMAKPTRTNTAAIFNLVETDFLFVLTQLRMSASLGVPLRHFEAVTVLHYAEGEEITEHYDFIDPELPNHAQEIAERGDRVVTFLIYLNDDYEAGQTVFPRLGIEHGGRRGEGLFFVNSKDGSADTRTLHAGRSPTCGDKWVITQFVRDRPML